MAPERGWAFGVLTLAVRLGRHVRGASMTSLAKGVNRRLTRGLTGGLARVRRLGRRRKPIETATAGARDLVASAGPATRRLIAGAKPRLAKRKAAKSSAAKLKTRAMKAAATKTGVSAKSAARRRPRRPHGRLEAFGWFVTAAVILFWPRERSPFDLQPIDWRSLFHGRKANEALAGVAGPAAAEVLEPGRGRAAQHPGEIPFRGWKDILWRAWADFTGDNIPQVAGGIAFFGILAIFPAMAAFVSLYGLFFDVATAEKQLRLLAGVVPAEALTLIGEQMVRIAAAKHAGLGVAFVVGLLVSLWSANAGMKSLFVGLNIAFEEKEKRNFLRLNLISLTFTLGAITFLMLALAAVVVVPIVLAFVGYSGSGMALLRWPLLFFGAVAGFAVLYRFGPSRQAEQWRWLTWGGAIAAVLWLLVSLLFSLYVTNFGHYDKTYGSLGAVIGFMSWIWVSTIAVLFGAELNSEIEHQTAVDTTTGSPRPMGARGARMADTLGSVRPAKAAKGARAPAAAAPARSPAPAR